MSPRASTALALAVAGALLAGCDAGAGPPGDPPSASPRTTPGRHVELGFTQLLPREGSRHALLRITNTGEDALDVTSVGVAWEGYDDASATPSTAVIGPGSTLDMRVRLPPPRCDVPGREPVVGVVGTAAGDLREDLEASGQVYIRRLWRTQCQARVLDRALGVSFSSGWDVLGTGDRARARGALRLTRRRTGLPVVVDRVDGSVLHGLRLPGPRVLGRGRQRVDLPLEITPGNRCDEHARGQATAPFDFLARLRVGRRQVLDVELDVPLAAQRAASQALDRACASRAG